MARTFFEKVWSDHLIKDLGDNAGLLQIDRLFLHELSGSHALRQLEESGRKPASAEQVFAVIDHVIDTTPGRTPSQNHLKAGAEMIESPLLRRMLLEGLDEVDLTLKMSAEIERFRTADRSKRPWAYRPGSV